MGDPGSSADSGSCSAIPQETTGPFPGDGTNGQNALALSGIVRSDIRSSLGGANGIAEGVALTLELTLVDRAGCAPLSGYAVYVWHCDRDGNYSMYSTATASESYLRGVQQTDANGKVAFTTIYPGCYLGRWPHIHFEIFDGLSTATSGNDSIRTSQLALPRATCDTVYQQQGYSQSVVNLSQITLATDNVFSDGANLQIPTITGSVASGYTAKLLVAV